jgi:hypothetical protein
MTPLRERMIADMALAGLAAGTQSACVLPDAGARLAAVWEIKIRQPRRKRLPQALSDAWRYGWLAHVLSISVPCTDLCPKETQLHGLIDQPVEIEEAGIEICVSVVNPFIQRLNDSVLALDDALQPRDLGDLLDDEFVGMVNVTNQLRDPLIEPLQFFLDGEDGLYPAADAGRDPAEFVQGARCLFRLVYRRH